MVEIQNYSTVPDGSGGYSQEWTKFKEVEAHVQPISGGEYFQAQQLEAKINYKVFTDFDGEITSGMRILYQNKVLTIDTVIDQGGLNEIMVIMCVESQVVS
jgi:SPP1 family predicted phage head-tail adaptor